MTQTELKDKFRDLLSLNPPLKEMEELFSKAVKSGALDYENEDPHTYRTAKIIYHAILSTMAESWKPLSESNRQEAENLKAFL